jgi:type II secretory ATPase GspE/PulE/Tfp pilus assembly ATPase PilB-like protein
LIRVTPTLRAAIAESSAVYELRKNLPDDFRTMRDDGMDKVARGETSIDEVLRATQDVDEA